MKQKSKLGNTCDIKYQNTPGREQMPNVATFQCHFLLVVAKAVFSFALGVKPIWRNPDVRSSKEKILQLCNQTSMSVMFGRGRTKLTCSHYV